MWTAIADVTGLDPVTIKSFLAFGMLLDTGAALQAAEVAEPWAHGISTRIHPALFEHITPATNRDPQGSNGWRGEATGSFRMMKGGQHRPGNLAGNTDRLLSFRE
jgi:hypothetical protein